MLDDRHQRNIDDAAAKKAYVDYSDLAHEALHGEDGLFSQQGADAHAAFPGTVEKLVDNHDKSLSKLDDVQRAALAPTMNERLRNDVERAADHVRQQGAAEQKWQSEQLKDAAARDAINHAGDPELFDHHMATGENAIRQQAKIDNLPDAELARQITDYRSGVQANAASDSSLAGTPIPANVDEVSPAAPTQVDDVGAEDARLDDVDPYANLRSLVSRGPGGGTLEDANFISAKAESAPDVVRARQSLARRWQSLDQQQRMADPELSLPAKMLEAMRAPLIAIDPRLRSKIGPTAAPAGKYVADQIVWMLEHKVLPRRIATSRFPTANEVRLGARGEWSNDALDALHEAANRALNARQQFAWNYFTSGDHPFTPEQAAGLIAALTRENNLDPEKWQGFRKDAPGYGIAQWNKHRREMFEKVMPRQKDGRPRTLIGSTFQEQLEFVRYELEHGEYHDFGAQLHRQTDAYQAGYLTTKIYEAPDPKTRERQSADRGTYAQQVLRQFAGH